MNCKKIFRKRLWLKLVSAGVFASRRATECTEDYMIPPEGKVRILPDATFKHFPGLGRARADTHFFRAEIDAPLAALETHDWVPYREALGKTQSLVMVGHVVVTAVDPERVATLSPKVVEGVLRGRLGHTGLVITDDLCMRPIAGGAGGLRGAGALALSAGVDLLLVSYDADQYWQVMRGLLEADAQGRIARTKLSASEARLGYGSGGRTAVASAQPRSAPSP